MNTNTHAYHNNQRNDKRTHQSDRRAQGHTEHTSDHRPVHTTQRPEHTAHTPIALHTQQERQQDTQGANSATHDHVHHATSATASGFASLNLLEPLVRAIAKEGYVTPTPIQLQTIPSLLAKKDLIGVAQTGTGKTAAFVLPLLQHLMKDRRPAMRGSPRVLILAPTRELAAQIGASISTYGQFARVSHTVIFGGVGQRPQTDALGRGVDIVVATPGRLLDLMTQRYVRLERIEIFVLDEADRMLDMGFIRDIRKIVAQLPAQRQTLFFSATMPATVAELAHSMVRSPVRVSITPDKPTVDKVQQKVMFVDQGNKEALLISLLKDAHLDKVIIFTKMKHVASKVSQRLEKAGIRSSAIHGNKSQSQRESALNAFRSNKVRALVATDIAARGIDVDGITHVINYDLPNEPETYVHRIGRTARAGMQGDAISFCSADEKGFLVDIERLIRMKIPVDSTHAFPAKILHAAPASMRGSFHRSSGRRNGGNFSRRR